MSTAITRIQLKYSTGTAAPTSLAVAEPAYSYASNTFFIGSPTGDGVIAIGGKFYLDQQQLAWDKANSAYSSASAGFDAANGAIAVNLTQNNSIIVALDTANAAYSNANNYITYNEAVNVRQNNNIDAAFAAANAAIAVNNTQNNSITVALDTANAAFDTANGAVAVNTTQNNRINAAYTRANNSLDANNGGTVTGDVSITGNLIVSGNVVSISTTEIVANDSLIILGLGNYVSDIVDIGFAGHYNDGTNAHAGIIRDATNKEFYAFDGYTPEIGANNNINPSDPSFRLATVNANLKAQTVQIKGIDILPYANGIYNAANAAFVRANNSLDANNGGTVTGNVDFTGTLKPTADVTWNLGSPDKRWHSLFVGAGTIDIGGLTIKNSSVNGIDTANFGGVQDIRISDASVGSFRQVAVQANSAFDHANAVFANSNTYITYNEAVSVTQNNSITAALNAANAAFVRANNSLDANNGGSVSGTVSVTGNVYAGNVIANGAVTSTGGTTKLVLSDIGIVAITAGGVETKFNASGIENSQGIYGGSFGGNKLSLNNETNLVSNRYDIVKIQTGDAGTVVNEWVFANNSLTAPGGITANGFTAGGINVVPRLAASFNTANAAFDAANGAIAVNLTQNNSIASSFAHANAAFLAANNAYDSWVRGQANAAFETANGAVAVNLTQNNSITVALDTANAAFLAANNAADSWVRNQANSSFDQANAAFTRANNSLSANNGGTVTGDVIINANLFVNGTTTFVNTVNQLIGDNIITLNADLPQDGYPTQDAGFEIERGVLPNSSILWIESAGKWSANNGNTMFYLGSEAGITAAGAYANAAFVHANAAFAAANTGAQANAAYFQANAAFYHANAAYSKANTADTNAGNAQSTADNAYTSACNALVIAQSSNDTSNAAFIKANAAFAQSNNYATASASVFNGTGDGTTTSFNLGYTPYSDSSASVVSIDGIVQYEGSYTLTVSNSSINFTDAPGAGERIRVLAYTSVNPYELGATGVTAGSYGNANTIGVFTTAANGQLTFATNVAIAIGASQITSGILPVNRGGTGADTFTTNGVLLGQGSGAFTTASSSTEGHVLTINSSGVPVFSYINGGTF